MMKSEILLMVWVLVI